VFEHNRGKKSKPNSSLWDVTYVKYITKL
jgi:hypothetical protein